MNIVYLKYAVEVAKEGSLNSAAKKLFIAQPNLSRAIKELETEMGIIIFERRAKGMVLTPEGERFIAYGSRILKQIDEVDSMFKGDGEKKNSFSVVVPRASYISHAFSRFSLEMQNEKRCEMYYKETNSSRAIESVADKGYGLGIVRYASEYDKYFKQDLDNRGLNYELVAEFKFKLIFSKKSALYAKKSITYDDLKSFVEIAHADPYVPSLTVAEIRKNEMGNEADKRIFLFDRASQFEILSANADCYMWVSPVPNELLERYDLSEREIKGDERVYRDVLIYNKNYKLSPLDKAFITCLCDAKRKYIKD